MILGILLLFVVGAFVRNAVGHYLVNHGDTATFLGVIAGLWAAWPLWHRAWQARRNFLHPPVRRYKLPVKQAFANVRRVLSNSTYNYGDKWHVSFADTMQKRISACLRFTDEEIRMEGHSVSRMYVRTERKQRLLELEVQFEEVPGGITLIQLDFHSKVEGFSLHACDRIIYALRNDLLEVLGPGEAMSETGAEAAKLSPPWCLIALTVLGLVSFTGAAMDHLAQSTQKLLDAPKELQQQKDEQAWSEQNMRDEIAAWKNFKERYNVR